MSDPWIKVYPADMRADPKFSGMHPAMRYALIQAWDLAKNGPGAVDELRSSDGRAMREAELRRLSSVSASATRRMFERWERVGLCEIEDGLVRFPNLAKRQGIDRTAAERMRRLRQRKRDGTVTANVTPARYGPVTAQNQNQSKNRVEPSNEVSTPPNAPKTATPKPRQPDPIWDALLEACPAGSEMTKSERGRRNAAVKELREINADPADVRLVARRLREKWGGRVALTPSAIVTNWSGTIAEIRPNGHGRTWTREDAERAAAYRAGVEEQQRQRAAAAEEGVPY